MMLWIYIFSFNAAELRITNSLERYLIIFRTGQVLQNCMHFLLYFSFFLSFRCSCIALKRIINYQWLLYFWQNDSRKWIKGAYSFWNFTFKKLNWLVCLIFHISYSIYYIYYIPMKLRLKFNFYLIMFT